MELFLDLMYMYNTYSFKIIGVFNWCNWRDKKYQYHEET